MDMMGSPRGDDAQVFEYQDFTPEWSRTASLGSVMVGDDYHTQDADSEVWDYRNFLVHF